VAQEASGPRGRNSARAGYPEGAAERRPVGNIHRHADFTGLAGQPFIERLVACADHNQRPPAEPRGGTINRNAPDMPHTRQIQRRWRRIAAGQKIDPRRETSKKTKLGRQRRIGANDKRRRTAKIDEDRKMPCHFYVPLPDGQSLIARA